MRDHNGQQLAYIYFEDEPGWRSAAKLLTRDETRADCREYRETAGAIAPAVTREERKIGADTVIFNGPASLLEPARCSQKADFQQSRPICWEVCLGLSDRSAKKPNRFERDIGWHQNRDVRAYRLAE